MQAARRWAGKLECGSIVVAHYVSMRTGMALRYAEASFGKRTVRTPFLTVAVT